MGSDLTERVRASRSRQQGADVARQDDRMANIRQNLAKMTGEFARVLPSHVPADLYARVVLTCVQKNPKLLDCTIESFLGSLMDCARLGLMPGTKEAALVPMGKTCTLIPQWQGLVVLMYNSAQVASVVGEFIHENDDWFYIPSRRPPDDFHHAPAKGDRGEITHAYAFAWLLNGSRSRVCLLTGDDAVYIRNRFSRRYQQAEENGKKDSAWHTDFWPMARKSAVRRVFDWVPSDASMRYFSNTADDDGEITSTYPAPPPVPQAAPPVEGGDPPSLTAGDDQHDADVAEGEITSDEPRAQSTMDYNPDDRRAMFSKFSSYLPGVPREEILRLITGFTGREVTASGQLTAADITDINQAFAAAEGIAAARQPEGSPPQREDVAAAFRELCEAATGMVR